MKTKFHDYGSNHVVLQVEDKEPIPDTIVLLDQDDLASTYKAVIKSKKNNTPIYHEYDYDKNYYWIMVGCTNCLSHRQISIPLKSKVNLKILTNTPCPSCGIHKTLRRVIWDGKTYQWFDPKSLEQTTASENRQT